MIYPNLFTFHFQNANIFVFGSFFSFLLLSDRSYLRKAEWWNNIKHKSELATVIQVTIRQTDMTTCSLDELQQTYHLGTASSKYCGFELVLLDPNLRHRPLLHSNSKHFKGINIAISGMLRRMTIRILEKYYQTYLGVFEVFNM